MVKDTFRLAEDSEEIPAGPFEGAEVAGYAECHFGGEDLDRRVLTEEGEEVGVGGGVEDDLKGGGLMLVTLTLVAQTKACMVNSRTALIATPSV